MLGGAVSRRVRRALEAQQHGVCVRCECDTDAWKRAYSFAMADARRTDAMMSGLVKPLLDRPQNVTHAQRVRERARAIGFDPDQPDWWNHDHIVPRALGGPDTLGNSQTLCGTPATRCHGAKTRDDLRDMAKARKFTGPRKTSSNPIPQRANPWPKGRKLQSRPMRRTP